MNAAVAMATAVKLNAYPEVGDYVAIHLCPGLLNPMIGIVTEIVGVHLMVELNDSPGVILVIPRSVCTWC